MCECDACIVNTLFIYLLRHTTSQRHPRVPVAILVEVNMKDVITNTTMEGYGQGRGELKTESAAAALGGAGHICSL